MQVRSATSPRGEAIDSRLKEGDFELARRIRVVRVIDRLNVGGPAKHVVWLNAALDDHQFESALITGRVPEEEGDMSYFARRHGVRPLVIPEMSREPDPRDLVVVLKLFSLFRRLQPDIVHTHKSKAGATGRAAALLYKWLTPSALLLRPRPCRVVHTYHGHVFHGYYGRFRTALFVAIERLLARLCTDLIITISEQQRNEISGRYGVGSGAQVKVIPLGLDLLETPGRPGQLRGEIGVGRDEPLAGIVGRLCEVKNHRLLLEAMAILRRSHQKRLRLAVIGDGHLRADLEALAANLEIERDVFFTGFREGVIGLYPDLDFVVLTSRNEGTPLTLIEAMSRGRAILSTEVGGVPDLMGEKRRVEGPMRIWDHGITVRADDSDGLAHALNFMIENPEIREEMGRLGRRFATTRFSRERLVNDIASTYRELLEI